VRGTDQELIRLCRKGDVRAWERLVDRYERLVFSIPLNYGLSREDAADIAQLTFTILIQTLDTPTEIERPGPWLATVARRHTWRLMERGRREGTSAYEDLAESGTLVGKRDTDSVEHWELTEWLHDGLSRLNEPCRELLQALYFDEEGSSYAEVAARLGRPVGSIGPTRARCLESLRKVMTGG
jgi:RNA polymerase sigma factor (sigma-70 family)